MKIEKINDNQIKCTLYRADLAARQLKITELAYGTDKTRGLLRDMMEQASDECGFEINDNPLMIEATPISMDCIVLMITRVDNPEDFNPEFADLNNMIDLLSEENAPDGDSDSPQGSHSASSRDVPFGDLLQFLGKLRSDSQASGTTKPAQRKPRAVQMMYSFGSLDDIINFAHQAISLYNGENSLYKSGENGRFYLIMDKADCDMRDFAVVCTAALEYGVKETLGPARAAYINEHFECMISSCALQKLAYI